jgi:membrane-associated protein
MDMIAFLVDFVLHVDVHLSQFVMTYGTWVYALLFLVIFVETGLVVMPFLPGDSLLFVVGALCGVGLMSLPLSVGLLTAAAILGNQTNYTIGHHLGPRVFKWEQSRFFNKAAFEKTHAFYETYGGVTIIAARFLPFLRTFAPFVAGVAHVTGGTLWVGSLTLAGYLFGNIPWVKTNLSLIIWALILLPGLLIAYGAWKARSADVQPG